MFIQFNSLYEQVSTMFLDTKQNIIIKKNSSYDTILFLWKLLLFPVGKILSISVTLHSCLSVKCTNLMFL